VIRQPLPANSVQVCHLMTCRLDNQTEQPMELISRRMMQPKGSA
jgi:hypothetical protein